jgi:DNA-binding MarR family transcriptional regulator
MLRRGGVGEEGGRAMNDPEDGQWKMPYSTGVALQEVYNETVALFQRMSAVLEDVHGQGTLTASRRDLLLRLAQPGPQTVPQLARARLVSRQAIQRLVDELATEGYVEFTDNIAHKRSPLVQLTPKGKDALYAMLQRERQLVAQMKISIPAEQLRTTAEGLRAVREWLEREHRRLMKEQDDQHAPAEGDDTLRQL